MNCNKKELLLYAVTDRSWLNGRTLYDQVEEALKGGATFIQLREKNLDTDSFLKEAAEIKELCARYHVPFVINDNVEIAKEINADGVHVGQEDMAASNARAILGSDKIIGVSAHTVEEAVLAEKNGAEYGAFSTHSPPGAAPMASAVPACAVATVISAIVGYLSICIMMRLIQGKKYKIFAVYCAIVGLITVGYGIFR